MADSEKLSLTDVDSDDEDAISARISDLVRAYGVHVMLHDERDDEGNWLITIFGPDDAAIYEASCDIDPSMRYTD